MPPSLKVQAAYKAMSAIGIPEKKTKPVLKKLLQVYDRNWALIEEENYRALADAIFDYEDAAPASSEQTKIPETVNQGDSLNEEDEEQDERPLKRLRRGQGGQPSASTGSTNTDSHVMKEPQKLADDGVAGYDVASGAQRLVDKGRRPMLSEGSEISRQVETSHPREITLGPLRLKEVNEETGVSSRKVKESDADSSLKSNEEPLVDGTPAFEMPLAVIHPVWNTDWGLQRNQLKLVDEVPQSRAALRRKIGRTGATSSTQTRVLSQFRTGRHLWFRSVLFLEINILFQIQCPRQPSESIVCGYYVIRFMKEIIESRKRIVPTEYLCVYNGRAYELNEIDDIREQWAAYMQKHLDSEFD